MDFIIENYVIIIFIGLFFIFALIGYLIDSIKNTKNGNIEEMPVIKSVDIKDINITENSMDNDEQIIIDNEDDLLKNYNESSID